MQCRNAIILLWIFLLIPRLTEATTYYVDPTTGSDADAGTSQELAWATIPGTMAVDGTAYLNAAWGSITTANKIQAGDVIYLKAGETQASGQVFICNDTGCNAGTGSQRPGFYSDGTSGSPIRIDVASDWGTGDFSFDFQNMTGYSTGLSTQGAIYIRVPYLYLQGASSSKRIKIMHLHTIGGVRNYMLRAFTHTGIETAYKGLLLRYIEVDGTNNGATNVQGPDISRYDNWIIADSHFHHLACTGCYSFSLGGWNDLTTNDGMVVNSEFSYSDGGGTIADARGVKFLNLRTHNHGFPGNYDGRGLNVGSIFGTGMSFVSILDTQSWGNYEHSIGHSGQGHKECEIAAQKIRVVHVNFIGHGGGVQYHNVKCYGGAHCLFYNSVLYGATGSSVNMGAQHRRGSCSGCGDSPLSCCDLDGNCVTDDDCTTAGQSTPCDTLDNPGPVKLTLRNTILRPNSETMFSCFQTADTTLTESPANPIDVDSDYNIMTPQTADIDTLANFDDATGCPSPTTEQCDHTAGGCDWSGAHDILTTADAVAFVDPNYTSWDGNSNDYRLQTGSNGIDDGVWYCEITSATGSGNSFNVDCDPKEFFYDIADYPGTFLAPDIAYIGVGLGNPCVIDDLSHAGNWGSTGTITCTTSVSWILGNGISRHPVYGSAPDIGADEYVACHGGT